MHVGICIRSHILQWMLQGMCAGVPPRCDSSQASMRVLLRRQLASSVVPYDKRAVEHTHACCARMRKHQYTCAQGFDPVHTHPVLAKLIAALNKVHPQVARRSSTHARNRQVIVAETAD